MLARLNNQGAAADGLKLSLPIRDIESSLAAVKNPLSTQNNAQRQEDQKHGEEDKE